MTDKCNPDLALIAHALFSSRTEFQAIRSSDTPDPIHTSLSQWTSCLAAYQGTSIRDVHSRLRAILPGDLDTEILTVGQLVSANDLAAAMLYINLVVYLLSNNLLGDKEQNKMIELLCQQKYM